ncbi:MAG: sulfotransferase [Planctomycetes bacterium]|nr:sulfotransferase [Planctomycetota bacterium]MCP4860322.1 sulfotransferase [Planctomycetota bacterium]
MSKLARIAKRHRMPLGKALLYEALVRAWRFPILRSVLRIPFGSRRPKAWIFLVGSYNAGTTIVKNAILSHPDVAGMPVEGDIMTSALDDFESGDFPRGMFANKERIMADRAGAAPDAQQLEKDWSPWICPSQRFLEKSISNSLRMPHLRTTFPGCRFVCVVRHPEDVAKGIRKRSRPQAGGEYQNDFLDQQWAFFYETMLNDGQAQDTAFCSYESFIQNPAEEVTRLFQELELSPVPIRHEGEVLHVGTVPHRIRPLPVERTVHASAVEQLKEHLAVIEEQQS